MESGFFTISKLAWFLIAPDHLLLLLLIICWILLLANAIRKAKILFSFIMLSLLTIACFPVGGWLLSPLETRFITNPQLPDKVDGLIVLSGPEDATLSNYWKQNELGNGAERGLTFLSLSRVHPNAKLVFTGGSGSLLNQEHKAADVAKKLYAELGFDVDKIIFEREARNTHENAIFSKNLVKPLQGENWLLITTAWHMPRSVGIFCKAGWPVIPYPVDHTTLPRQELEFHLDFASNMTELKTAVKEWVGLFAYYLTGKTTALLPESCN